MDGTILLHRRLLESYAFSNETTLKIWIWLLLKAKWKTGYFEIEVGKGKRTIELKRGQMLFGRIKAAEKLGIPASTIERHLEKLKYEKQISILKTANYSIISIKKYNDYQVVTQDSEQPMNSQRAANEQPTGTYNKVNKENKDNIEPKGSSADKPAVTPESPLRKEYKELQKDKVSVFNFIQTSSPDFIEPYVDYWNIFAEEKKMPKVVSISKSRKRKFYIRLKEESFKFTQILRKAAFSNFILSGNWFGFDWIIENENNYLKVLEGKYDNGKDITETHKPVINHKSDFQKATDRQRQKLNED